MLFHSSIHHHNATNSNTWFCRQVCELKLGCSDFASAFTCCCSASLSLRLVTSLSTTSEPCFTPSACEESGFPCFDPHYYWLICSWVSFNPRCFSPSQKQPRWQGQPVWLNLKFCFYLPMRAVCLFFL